MHTSSERIFLWIVRIGLFAIPLLPLYVSSSMLFPFITGKNFAFRIIIEIIFAFWVGLAVMQPAYRPRLTPLFKIITVFIAIVFLADILSPNPYRAFFSNYERMEGFMMLGHLYLYFVMLTSVFKTRRDWLIFLHVSLAASLIASYYGLLQRLGYRVSLQGGFRVDSTIGNPTYFAAYLLFHVWLMTILIHQFWKRWWQAALYGAILLFELVIIYFTATRGVVVALALVVPPFLAALVYFWNRITALRLAGPPTGILTDRRPGRKIAAGVLVLSVAVPLLFWGIRRTEFVQSSQALRRLTNYSLGEGTIQDRIRIWKMSLQGVRERPILGWGQENYYLVFQKYFDPGLYGAEPWFDRSHNVFLDWAVHAGIMGLGAYLAILGAALWQIIRAMRSGAAIFFEGLALIGLFATDFLQKLFVFDNLSSYLLFFAFISYSQFASPAAYPRADPAPTRAGRDPRLYRSGVVAVAVMLVAVAVWGWWANVRAIRESKALIAALQTARGNADIHSVEAAFSRALAYQTFGDTEVREQLGNLAREVAGMEGPADLRRNFVQFALAELRQETSHPAKDVKHLLFMLTVINRGLTLDSSLVQEGETIAAETMRLSPTKQVAGFEVAQYYLGTNRLDRAVEVLESVWRGEPRFQQAAQNLWIVAIMARRPDLIEELRRVWTLNELEERIIFNIARAYQQVEDFASARDTYAVLVAIAPQNPQYRATYAALLARTGNSEEARRQTEEAIRIDPNFGREGGQFLEQLP